MRLSKSFRLALNILLHSKLRSWLTILGIIIGVAAVVSIVSIGEGMQQSIETQLGGLGADLISISPGGSRAMMSFKGGGMGGGFEGRTVSGTRTVKNLTKTEVLAIRTIPGVKHVHGIVSGKAEVYYLGEKTTTSVEGVDPLTWNSMTTSELEKGRLLGASDYGAVIVGSRIAKSTFKTKLAINQVLTVEGKSFKIVGILEESGSGGMGGGDSNIIMSISAARDVIEDVGDKKYDTITVQVTDVGLVDQVAEIIDKKLILLRHTTADKKDYSITTATAMQERMSDITQTLTLFLGGIAAISLLVGAVGIANTMFTSTLEKTREIGIMKSIGAKNRDIMAIFLMNSGMVGFVGGLLGVLLGTGISKLLPLLGMRLMGMGRGDMTTAVTPGLLLFVLGLSVTIGMIAGIIPAYKASKLKPVDALRYE